MKQLIIRVALSWLPLVALCIAVRPSSLPVVLLIVPFILLFVALYATFRLVHILLQRASGKVLPENQSSKRPAAAISSFIVLIMITESLGQLGIRDIITFGLIFIVGYFYIVRWSRRKAS